MTDIDAIALELGTTGRNLRSRLRRMYPDQAPGTGGRWELTSKQVVDLRADVQNGVVTSRLAIEVAPALLDGPSAEPPRPYRDEWFWEGNVQTRAAAFLETGQWTILRMADTGIKERGDDILATRDGLRLSVEVKGYPSVGYADPRRVLERKRTHPSIQAKHWFAEALLRSVRSRSTAGSLVAMALPEFQRYEDLLADTRPALERLGIGVITVRETDARWQLLPAAAPD